MCFSISLMLWQFHSKDLFHCGIIIDKFQQNLTFSGGGFQHDGPITNTAQAPSPVQTTGSVTPRTDHPHVSPTSKKPEIFQFGVPPQTSRYTVGVHVVFSICVASWCLLPFACTLPWRQMTVMTSQIISNFIVCSTSCSGQKERMSELHITDSLWGETTGDQWLFLTKGQ